MSKERLEEIKQIRNDMEEYINPDGSVEDYPRYDELALFIIDDYLDWLIEQAERVQELEERNKFLEKAHQTNLKIAQYAQEQNKRYREALEYIADNKIEHGWNLKAVNCVVRARRALEGEG